MAITEYKLIQKINDGRYIPEFIIDGGYWPSPIDFTIIGWYNDEPGEFVLEGQPEFVEMTKSQLISRMLAIHNVYPMMKNIDIFLEPSITPEPLTENEISQMISVWYDDTCARNVSVTSDINRLKSKKLAQAFKFLEKKIEDAVVEVAIASTGQTHPFGCDRITQENIIGINTAIARNIAIPNPTYWTPKGSPAPITVTHDELAAVGAAILNKKNDLYMIYFGHKSNIMSQTDPVEVAKYDFAIGF